MSGRDQRSVGISLYVLALLTVLHTLSLTDRFLIAAFGTQISVDLGLSNQQFGLVTGLAFTLFYASTGPVAGLLVDRFGPGRLLGVGVLIWSAMTVLTGMAKSFLGLWLPRALVGVRGSYFDPCGLEDSEYRFEGATARPYLVCFLWVATLASDSPTNWGAVSDLVARLRLGAMRFFSWVCWGAASDSWFGFQYAGSESLRCSRIRMTSQARSGVSFIRL